MNNILITPVSQIGFVDFLEKSERQLILKQWSRGKRIKLDNLCFHELFEKKVCEHPQRLAVVYKGQELTYDELNRKANQLARLLRANKLESEEPVGVFLPRSTEMLIAIMAALKAGGVYLPLDPDYPSERLDFIIRDSGLLQVITIKSLRNRLPQTVQKIITMDHIDVEIEAISDDNLDLAYEPENGAYIIYTSGSTGKPKGVFIQHSSMINLLRALEKDIYSKFGKKTLRASLNAPILFDASVQQIVLLAAGHTLYIVPAEARMSGDDLLRFIREHKLEVLDCVPSQLKLLLDAGLHDNEQWQPLICLPGGEAIDEKVWQQLKSAPRIQYFNVYGPTECTVDSTIAYVNNSETRPVIGKPIANAYVYVLDENFQIVPAGVTGQICIGGVGLARGYLGRPELTAERFIHNPYSEMKGARMYLTGDLGRFRKDGTLEFLGRLDHQVKVRGFRIELGEIEANLQEYPKVKDAVVITVDVSGSKQLAAYLVSDKNNKSSITEIRDFLSSRLPEYMIPSYFTFLDALPLTPNGKVDRKRLPSPQINRESLQSEYVEPRNEHEQILTDIWKGLLNTARIGIKDNFFELGGDSILSIQLIARAKQAGLNITPKQIFENPTIEDLAAVATKGQAVHAEQGLVTGKVILTPIQRRFFELDFSDPHHWNQSLMLETEQPLDGSLLKQVLAKILEHHDALRLRVDQSNGTQQLYIADPDEAVPFDYYDYSELPSDEQVSAIAAQADKLQASLNLQQGPILRAAYFKRDTQHNDRLLLIIHHLAVDTVSWRILSEDIQLLYNQMAEGKTPQLPPKSTSFKFWSEQLAAYGKEQIDEKETAFWLETADKSQTGLSVDFRRGPNDEASLVSEEMEWDAELTQRLLKELPSRFNAQFLDALLTALVRAFARWNGQQKIWLGLEGHGRENLFEHVDLSRTVGWFTTLYPVLLDISGIVDRAAALQRIKDQMRRIPNNGIGFGLLKYFAPQNAVREKLAGIPEMDIVFNYLGQFETNRSTSGVFRPITDIKMAERSPRARRANLWDIGASIVDGVLKVRITFSRNLFKNDTVHQFLNFYLDELNQLAWLSQTVQEPVYTASDFKEAELDDAELDDLLSELDDD